MNLENSTEGTKIFREKFIDLETVIFKLIIIQVFNTFFTCDFNSSSKYSYHILITIYYYYP